MGPLLQPCRRGGRTHRRPTAQIPGTSPRRQGPCLCRGRTSQTALSPSAGAATSLSPTPTRLFHLPLESSSSAPKKRPTPQRPSRLLRTQTSRWCKNVPMGLAPSASHLGLLVVLARGTTSHSPTPPHLVD